MEGSDNSAFSTDRPIVVAVIDTGGNPYYDLFGTPRSAPVDSKQVKLTSSGTLAERFEVDEAFWTNAELGVLYSFEGTRAMSIAFSERTTYRGFDSYAHGAGVNYVVAREAPSAVVVSVQVWPGDCPPEDACLSDPSMAAGMEWAAAQPWIDIITSSMGVPTPDIMAADPVMARWVRATEAAASQGKIVVSSAGNEPRPTFYATQAGPPWVITVGGSQVENRGEQYDSSRLVDVVGNYTEALPSPSLDGSTWWVYGTSFAAPNVAGTLANAIGLVRAKGQSSSTGDLRSALNASAVMFNFEDWQPVPAAREDPLRDLSGASLPVLTQAQMGWGYVNSSLAPEIARRLFEGDLNPPAEKDQAILVQAQYQRAREEYWANWPR